MFTTPIKDKTHDQIDYVVVRENTCGLYVGAGNFKDKETPNEVSDKESFIYKQVERCLRFEFKSV